MCVRRCEQDCTQQHFVAIVRELMEKGIQLYYVIQTPGSVVYSPPSARGAGHAVFSVGPNILQTAWNQSISTHAFRACLGIISPSPTESYPPTHPPAHISIVPFHPFVP